ncbi:MAG: STAS domain-containing protein [Synergistetes bacterium]|nr:STAS domain-containing protein [Synergistota bacterium]
MGVSLERKGVISVIRVDGEVSVETAGDLRDIMLREINEGRVKIIVDLSGTTYIDSTGLGILISGLRKVGKEGGDLKILGPLSPQVKRIFELTRLNRVFEFFDDEQEALSSF